MNSLRFAYLSSNDPRNKKVWSGTHYSLYKVLNEIGEVEILGPFEPRFPVLVSKLINQITLRLFGKRMSYRHSKWLSKSFAKYFEYKLKNKSFDYIFAPAASTEIAFLKTNIPIIYLTDGTFASCINYHKSLTNLLQRSAKEGNLIEQLAIDKSKYVIVSSSWAAHSVVSDYKKNKAAVYNIPFGANFDKLPSKLLDSNSLLKPFKLLFVGVYWETKGGPIAVKAIQILKQKGYDVELTVVGCEPPNEILNPNIKVVPFIDKNSESGQNQLSEIFSTHHLLLLPTRFDCTPIVINEASAFGLPSLVSNSGGVEGHLKTGVNGFLIDYKDSGEAFANQIEKLMLNPEIYSTLRNSSRQLYESQLNWAHWKKEFLKIINS